MVKHGQAKDVVEKLTGQHEQVVQVVKDFCTILDDVRNITNATKARGFLDELGSLLDIHLKIEDELLYPILKKSLNTNVKNTAISFSNEMGSIADNIGHYMNKWNTSISIANESEYFIKETKALVSLLLKRIDRENKDLFPLLTGTS